MSPQENPQGPMTPDYYLGFGHDVENIKSRWLGKASPLA
jgi:hypothetical protein